MADPFTLNITLPHFMYSAAAASEKAPPLVSATPNNLHTHRLEAINRAVWSGLKPFADNMVEAEQDRLEATHADIRRTHMRAEQQADPMPLLGQGLKTATKTHKINAGQ